MDEGPPAREGESSGGGGNAQIPSDPAAAPETYVAVSEYVDVG
jgi:hypothetical protein